MVNASPWTNAPDSASDLEKLPPNEAEVIAIINGMKGTPRLAAIALVGLTAIDTLDAPMAVKQDLRLRTLQLLWRQCFVEVATYILDEEKSRGISLEQRFVMVTLSILEQVEEKQRTLRTTMDALMPEARTEAGAGDVK